MSGLNPYDLVGKEVVGDRFVPRPGVAVRIQRTWQDEGLVPGNLSVLGHHRTGKTTLVKWAAAQCRRHDLCTVHLTLGEYHSGADVFRAIVHRVFRADGNPGDFRAVVGACASSHNWSDLSDAVRTFFEQRAARQRYAVIVLDEFDRAAKICQHLAEFQLLRSLASEPMYGVGLVIVSRARIITIEKDAAGGSILDGVVTMRQYVGVFTQDEAATMLRRSSQAGIDLTGIHKRILELSGTHPYLLELLCESVITWYHGTGEMDIEAAYENVMSTFEDYFGHLIGGVVREHGNPGMDLLQSLAAGKPTGPRSRAALNQFRQMGIVIGAQDSPELFSNEFGRYLSA